MLGTFLQQADLSAPDNRWYHPSLRYACEWLQRNNPYLVAYHSLALRLLKQSEQSPANLATIWPQATHISEDALYKPILLHVCIIIRLRKKDPSSTTQ